jgi:hypothetical protein
MAKHRRLKSLEVRRAVNGVTIRHETEPIKHKSTKGDSPVANEYEPPQEHAFNDHGAAHAHVTKHLAQMFGRDQDDEESGESAAEERAEKEKPADRKDDVAAFRRLRKKGHLS